MLLFELQKDQIRQVIRRETKHSESCVWIIKSDDCYCRVIWSGGIMMRSQSNMESKVYACRSRLCEWRLATKLMSQYLVWQALWGCFCPLLHLPTFASSRVLWEWKKGRAACVWVGLSLSASVRPIKTKEGKNPILSVDIYWWRWRLQKVLKRWYKRLPCADIQQCLCSK